MLLKSPNTAERMDDFLARYLCFFNFKRYISNIKLKGDEKVLEIGCGGGNLSRFIAKKAGKLICIDISPYWIKKAKKRLKKYNNIKLKLGNIINLNDSYFDVVIIHYVLHDIQKDQRRKMIEVLRNGLKEGGRVYLREPTRKNHGMPAKEIKNLFISNGFKEIYFNEKYSILLRSFCEAVFLKNTKKAGCTKKLEAIGYKSIKSFITNPSNC